MDGWFTGARSIWFGYASNIRERMIENDRFGAAAWAGPDFR
jgi:hypothetical protein